MRILEAGTCTVDNGLKLVDHADGHTELVYRGEKLVATAGDDDLCRVAGFMLRAGPLPGKTVAWLGGGLCLGPRLFATAGCKQTVYEIEPALAEFCPQSITFVPGDYTQ